MYLFSNRSADFLHTQGLYICAKSPFDKGRKVTESSETLDFPIVKTYAKIVKFGQLFQTFALESFPFWNILQVGYPNAKVIHEEAYSKFFTEKNINLNHFFNHTEWVCYLISEPILVAILPTILQFIMHLKL